MRDRVGCYEAKTYLPRLLAQVERGARITITRHGIPVAMLVPTRNHAWLKPGEAIEGIKAFRRTHKLGQVSIRELIEEGRRY